MTSHDVVAKVRRALGIKKVGHSGTLDPLATGVLVVCVGDATRLSEYAMSTQKVYVARVRLGVETTTYDAEGEIVAQVDAAHITPADVEAALLPFVGEIDQIPPAYSAIKKGGRKLYELARAGETVELEARRVRIDSLRVTEWDLPDCMLEVVCGSGTYIRSLAHDIGAALGVGAHLADLRRTRSGTFKIEDAVSLDDLLNTDNPADSLMPPDAVLLDAPAIHLTAETLDHVGHGRAFQWDGGATHDLARAYAPDGRMVAVLRLEGGLARPHKVFSSQIDAS